MAKVLLKRYLYHNAKSNETVARKYVQRICCESHLLGRSSERQLTRNFAYKNLRLKFKARRILLKLLNGISTLENVVRSLWNLMMVW